MKKRLELEYLDEYCNVFVHNYRIQCILNLQFRTKRKQNNNTNKQRNDKRYINNTCVAYVAAGAGAGASASANANANVHYTSIIDVAFVVLRIVAKTSRRRKGSPLKET